jgi:hypothetical protein
MTTSRYRPFVLCLFVLTLPFIRLKADKEATEYTFSTIRWQGSQTLWYSTMVKKSDLTDRDLLQLRVPEDTFERHAWVNREIFVHSRIRSEDLTYAGPGNLKFFSEPPRTRVLVHDNGSRSFETETSPVTSIRLENADTDWLLLFTQRGEDPEELSIFPIADQTHRFPKGSVQFFNLSPHDPLIVIFGSTARRIAAEESAGFLPSEKTGDKIVLHLADPDTNPDNPIYSNMWYHEDDRRFMILVTEKSRNRRGLDLKVIRR